MTDLTDAEIQTRRDLAALYRLVAHFKMTDLIDTHISARIPGTPDHFLINRYGVLFHEMRPEDLVKIDPTGAAVEAKDTTERVNAAGFTIHSAVHMARHDLACVIHTHTADGIGVSCQEEGLLPISQHALKFYGHLAYHDYEGIALDLEERDRLVASLGQHRVMILRNHGLLAAGRSVGEAFQGLYFLERSCAIQIAAQAGGAELVTPSDAVLQKTAQVYASGTGGRYTERIWDAFLRELDRDDPDYRL